MNLSEMRKVQEVNTTRFLKKDFEFYWLALWRYKSFIYFIIRLLIPEIDYIISCSIFKSLDALGREINHQNEIIERTQRKQKLNRLSTIYDVKIKKAVIINIFGTSELIVMLVK
jgi:hypothetical protein